MADIALLVAEDYERRVRASRNKQEEIDLVSWVAKLGQKVNIKFGQQRIEAIQLAFEPKTQIGIAAFNGTFSA
ncbi:hypothetical protein E1A91_A02G151100v1 [Gossypium mustelinum]|uniref:Uncharacterized protein n=1 Tax=Gossypium mustelinum TaxID=34275 RepID=A0A5D3A5G4_GOSMU|nr:hypothetical protein E1A91_A02G151100v1 [Gossypium mustelinum]